MGGTGTHVAASTAHPAKNLWLPRGAAGILPDAVNGALQSLLCVFSAVGYAVLIFAHAPAGSLPVGLGVLLTGTLVLNLVLAFGSRVQPVLAGPQDTTSVLLAVMAASVSADLGTRAPEAVLPTILTLILVATVALGGTYLLLGVFRLGQAIRFLPFPVLGGFLAGTGWLLALGAIGVMTARPLTGLGDITPTVAGQLAAGFAVVLALFALQRLVPHSLTMIGALAAALVVFFFVLFVLRVPVAEARDQGWLLMTLPSGSLLQPHWVEMFGQADWGVVFGQAGNIFTLAAIGTVAALLNIAGIEVIHHHSADVDRELRVRGIANLLTGFAGGAGGYDALSRSMLAYRGGARGRLVPLIAAAVTCAVLLGGSALLADMPRFLVGGMMLFIGLGLLIEWVVGSWARLPRMEYAIVVLITAVIAVVGFFPGVIVGIMAAVVLFAVNYSRTGAIKHDLPGTARHSTVDRPLSHLRALGERGVAIHVFELHGYIFFGTAHRILQRVRERLTERESIPLRYAILDFRAVPGLDSSAAYSFTMLRQLARDAGVDVIFTHLTPTMRRSLGLIDGLDAEKGGIQVFEDVDHALEWCENQLLHDIEADGTRPLAEQLAEEMDGAFSAEQIQARLLDKLELVEVPTDAYLARQGDAATDMYLVRSGRIAVTLELPSGEQLRLRVMSVGALVGELAFYRHTPRSASVIALEPTTIFRITRDGLADLAESDPTIVAAFHAFVARVLSERLSVMDASVAALLR